MNVFIIDHGFNHSQRFQIMMAAPYGLAHVFPSQIFTLEDAINICNRAGWTIEKIGSIWQCAN